MTDTKPKAGEARASGTRKIRGLALSVPAPEQVLGQVLSLSRAVSLEMHDEEIVHAYVSALQKLFPQRRLAVRLFDPESNTLTLVYATGRLRSDSRETIHVRRETLRKHGMLESAAESPVHIVDDYCPLFSEQSHGFDVPIGDGDRLAGVIAVEYPDGVEEPELDQPRLIPIVLQLAASLRNARLLRESTYLRDYLGKLLEHANAPVVVVGRRREIRVVNRALLSLTGFRREELLGRDFLSILPEEDGPRVLPVYINALRGQSATSVEVRLARQGGGHVRIAMNTAAILSADGEVEGVIAIGRDMTELRELQQRVIQAEKLATLGQLAAGVVHELNNPLTSISVYSEHLRKRGEATGADPKDQLKLARISESADRMLNFTRELLSYARPSPEEPRQLDLQSVLEKSLSFCEHIIEDCGAVVELEFGDDLPSVYGVPGQLQQVLVNLITNACHAMPEGAGQLRLTASADDEGAVTIRVKDNGSGIAPDHLGRIFEPFFSTKGSGKGTGLGLSIVRNIVESHNGDIEVESDLGHGTTFQLTFVASDVNAFDDE